jgi:hypothetical protein
VSKKSTLTVSTTGLELNIHVHSGVVLEGRLEHYEPNEQSVIIDCVTEPRKLRVSALVLRCLNHKSRLLPLTREKLELLAQQHHGCKIVLLEEVVKTVFIEQTKLELGVEDLCRYRPGRFGKSRQPLQYLAQAFSRENSRAITDEQD